MPLVISIENLGKSYMIGHQGKEHRYVLLRDVVTEAGRKLWSRISHPEYYTHDNIEEFWALQNINLEVRTGDRLGIIGRNGAGKTTLLKLLSRITNPTAGEIKIRGRVASLLEVGTGFHPELTGRENIYLNGAILGMTRKEIRRKFDEIVDFAGVENFLDTPVKRFSSGMYVRLGFSVAAHLEPEILVVDEVLAVGDASFQKKCIGKMNSVAKEGRTILFVSHQMQAVTNLCNRAILLARGKLELEGNTKQVVSAYLNQVEKLSAKIPIRQRVDRQGLGQMRWTDTWIENSENLKTDTVISGESINIVASFEINDTKVQPKITVAFALYNHKTEQLTDLMTKSVDKSFQFSPSASDGKIVCTINKLPLAGGNYTYNLMLRNNDDVQDFIQEAGNFTVEDGDFFGTGKTIQTGQGSILIEQLWSLFTN